MLVGNEFSLNYTRTYEKATTQERSRFVQQMIASTGGSAAHPILQSGAHPSAGSLVAGDSKSEDQILYEDSIETRPQLLQTKIQQLKNTTKIAKVIIIDENPIVRIPQTQTTRATDNHKHSVTNPNMSSSLSQEDIVGGSRVKERTLLTPKSLLYYPEENHIPSEEAC